MGKGRGGKRLQGSQGFAKARGAKKTKTDAGAEGGEQKGSSGWWDKERKEDAVTHNDDFVEYYRAQKICSSEAEFEEFINCLKTPLPAAVRVNRASAAWRTTRKVFQDFADLTTKLSDVTAPHDPAAAGDDSAVDDKSESGGLEAAEAKPSVQAPIRELKWFPGHLAWQWTSMDKKTIRKDVRMRALKDFLIKEELRGGINRQETVSMLPPVLLDVQPHHLLLDMCAAPGSKTTEIMDMMIWPRSLSSSSPAVCSSKFPPCLGVGVPSGVVIANEIVAPRSSMLSKQIQRIPSAHVAVTCLDGCYYPPVLANTTDEPSNEHPSSKSATSIPNRERVPREEWHFDRILADVPCSGDGTLRKQPGIWRDWNVREVVLGLHPRQANILTTGVHRLAVGGRLVYSTCSLNPIENEAVVASVVSRYREEVRIVDVRPSETLPDLKVNPGLTHWLVPRIKEKKRRGGRGPSVASPQGDATAAAPTARPAEQIQDEAGARSTSTVEVTDAIIIGDRDDNAISDSPEGMEFYNSLADVPADSVNKIRESLFPPADAKALGLEHCLRLLPHANDTGGFFVAVLEKVKHLKKGKESKRKKPDRDTTEEGIAVGHEASVEAVEEGQPPEVSQEGEDVVAVPVPEDETVVCHEGGAAAAGRKRVRNADVEDERSRHSHVFVPLEGESATWRQISDFYGIRCSASNSDPGTAEVAEKMMDVASPKILELPPSDKDENGGMTQQVAYGFETLSPDNLVHRTLTHRRLYCVSRSLSNLLQHYKLGGVHRRFVHAGVRVFEEIDAQDQAKFDGKWRIAQDGASTIVRYMTKRVIGISKDVARALLVDRSVKLPELLEAEKTGGITNLGSCRKPDGLFLTGGVVAVISTTTNSSLTEQPRSFEDRLESDVPCIACILSRGTLQAYIGKQEAAGLLSLFWKGGSNTAPPAVEQLDADVTEAVVTTTEQQEQEKMSSTHRP